MHPGGMRSAMDLFDFEKSANLKHPSVHRAGTSCLPLRSPLHQWLPVHTSQIPALSLCAPCLLTPPTSLSCALPTCSQPWTGGPSFSSPAPEQRFAASWQRALSSDRPANDQAAYELELSFLWISVC